MNKKEREKIRKEMLVECNAKIAEYGKAYQWVQRHTKTTLCEIVTSLIIPEGNVTIDLLRKLVSENRKLRFT